MKEFNEEKYWLNDEFVKKSISKRNVIENLTIKNSGKFWDYNGEFIPW